MLEGLRHIKPATSFRSGYAYDNILYMAAGQLIEEVSGETWEKYIHSHVFGPLGMKNSTDTDVEFQANPNHARPHSRNDGPVHGMGTQTPLDENATIAQNAAPAGGLAPVFEAFFWIQSRATFKLSSAPALSLQTVTDIPPSALRSSAVPCLLPRPRT